MSFIYKDFSVLGKTLPEVGPEHWFGGAKSPHMQNQKIIRFVQALILLPIMSVSGQVGPVPNGEPYATKASLIVFLQKENMNTSGSLALNQVMGREAEARNLKAGAIDAYFQVRNMPLEGLGMKMVLEAEKNGLDWRIIAAIAVRESTGGKFECKRVKNNPFGWGSCKISFNSYEKAIETVAHNLGGNNPKTARHYDDKTTKQILRAYNPPSVVPRYAEQVMSIMNAIGEPEIGATLAKANT